MNNCQTTKNSDLWKGTANEGKVRESCLLDKIRRVWQRKEFKIVKSFLKIMVEAELYATKNLCKN
jgi:hypothetical protein